MAGGECASPRRWPCSAKVCSSHTHPRLSSRDLQEGAWQKGARCLPPSLELGWGGGATRRRSDRSLPGPGPQAYATVTVKPSSPARLLKVGAVVLISGAVLLLFGAIGAFYFWKGSDNHVSPEDVAQGCGPESGCAGPGGARGRGVLAVTRTFPSRWSQSAGLALSSGSPPANFCPPSHTDAPLFALGNFMEKQARVLTEKIKR